MLAVSSATLLAFAWKDHSLCLHVNQNQTRAWNAHEIPFVFTFPPLLNQMYYVGGS